MVKITGAKQHEARLRRLTGAKANAAILKGLMAAGAEIKVEAQHSITEGSISGKGHIPSAPGEPPNNDTGGLKDSIVETPESMYPPMVHVTAGGGQTVYAPMLEFGTSRMEERPFMRPATAKKRHRAAEIIARVFKMATK